MGMHNTNSDMKFRTEVKTRVSISVSAIIPYFVFPEEARDGTLPRIWMAMVITSIMAVPIRICLKTV